MKIILLFITLLIAISCFADELFDEAVTLFDKGLYFEAEKKLNEYLKAHEHENAKEIVRVRAMLEYIARRNPDNRDVSLKEFQTIVDTKKIEYNIYSAKLQRGIMILKLWKKDGVPESWDLSQILLQILDRADSTAPKTDALQNIYYRAEILALRGETKDAAKLLEEAIAHYYPSNLSIEKLSRAEQISAVRLYLLLGDVYTAMAAQSMHKDDKIKYHSLAGTAWLKAYPRMEKKSVIQTETVQKLRDCAETLSMLGYRLILPAEILKAQRNSYYPFIQKMLNEKRFSGAGKVIEQKLAENSISDTQKKELFVLKLISLAGQKKYSECSAFLQKNRNVFPVDPESLAEYLKLSHTISAFGNQEDAYGFLSILAAMPYESRDLEKITFKCANLSMKCEKIDMAKFHFENAANLTHDVVLKQQALFQAAQCADKLKNGTEVLRLTGTAMIMDVPGTIRNLARVLHLQTVVSLEKYDSARADAELLLSLKDLNNDLRAKVLLLAAISAERSNSLAEADFYLTAYLTENPDSANYFSVFDELKRVKLAKNDLRQLTVLCELALSSHNTASETYRCILELGDLLCQKKEFGESLQVYKTMLKIKTLTPDQLIVVSDLLSSGNCVNESGEANDIANQLLEKHLPEFSEDTKIKELYFRLAESSYLLKKYEKAIACLKVLLSEQKIYRAEDVFYLYGRILDRQGVWTESTNVWRKLLLTSKKQNRLEIIHNLSFAEMKSGFYKRAVATAFLAVPADGKRKKDEHDNHLILACLDILLKSAKEANLMEEYNEAVKMKEQLERK